MPISSAAFVDSHCHLDFPEFEPDRQTLLQQCRDQQITTIVLPGIEPAQWAGLSELTQAAASPRLLAAYGLHPWWVEHQQESPEEFQLQLQQQIREQGAVAIGECGLDGAINCPLERQQAYLEVQLQLACELDLPLILHGHRAHNPLLRQIKAHRPKAGGVIHGFSGSPELARQYWAMGFYIGVGGSITYERARKTRSAVVDLPLESLVLETDAPAMPLQGHQGRRNSPLALLEVARCLARLRELPLEDIARQTSANARRLFNLQLN
ncbi:TatD family hydrolase [Pseudomaricurvus alkylphenolicus]|jgi:TatD DNase family protein|uniref:TatD family hydrolase n=1 Tax=Pseudomaricurvus alkylphenolicus TaxID=1306991 RepID=UPI0014218671|nr:TatD family hydrolase [Pseudomaricurvus alkylphenolicus]NIB44264.1 TatD family hydrolase [Pseudomaricurvus alkylphenolicus]